MQRSRHSWNPLRLYALKKWLALHQQSEDIHFMQAGQIDSLTMAKYILAKVGSMNHLKLQKLLYYVEGWHLGVFDVPVTDAKFQAWMHGPVCTTVWHSFKNSQSPLYNDLSVSSEDAGRVVNEVESQLCGDQIELIGDVLHEYGDKGAYHLECLTHSEWPWIKARGSTPPESASSAEISQEDMRQYFRSLYGEVQGEDKAPPKA